MMLVGKWLKGIGLDYAVPTFEAAGIVTAEALSELDPTHFESLGVTSPDDRRKLFFLVQRVKQAQKSEQRESSAKVSPKKAVAAAATATAQPASDTTTSNSKAVAKGTTTAASAAVAATQSQDSSTSKLVKPKNGSATAAATRARTTAAAVAPSRQERTSRNATKGGSVVKKEEEEDRPGSDADDANGVPARQNDDEENEEAVVPIVRSASSYDDDEDSEEVPRRRTSTSSTAANRRLSGVPIPSKRRTSGHKGRAGGGGESSTGETTATTMAASEMLSTRTGKALSSIPAESVAPMSPLVNISLAMDDDRRKNDGRADLSREKLRDMGQVTQRTARRASSMRSRSEEEDSNQSADADSSASALPNRPAAKTENHRLSRAQSLQNGHDRAGSGHECPPASSNPFAAQIERLREQNAAATAASGSSTQSQQSFRIDPSQRVSVVVRKRPASHDVDMLQVLPPNRLLVYQPRTRVDLRREIATTSFRFDAVVDEVTSNTAVYENVVRPLLPNLARGQNSTVFCFGQTNSGKTHTLLGTTTTTTAAPSNDDEGSGATDHGRDAPFVRSKVSEPGLYYLAAVDIFDMLSEMKGLSVVVSLLELYDRKVLDLLNDRAPVPCWEDGSGKVQFPGLSLHPVYSAEQLQRLIEQGHALRSIGTTSKNSESSRSHAVLQLHINQAQNRKHRRYATMTFIDLAGSERGADTALFSSTTRMEGAEINTSLLALKEVLRAMSSSDSTHVPFRGSKLTQILKESLVDSSSTCVMIACVCPNMSHCEPTLNTLRYANCLKEFEKSSVTNRPRIGPKQPESRPIRTPPMQNNIRSPPSVTVSTHLTTTTPSPSIPSRTSSAISEVSADASAVLDDILSSPGEADASPSEQAASHDRQLRAAQSLLHSHKESMTAMLAMAKDEMTLVCNHSGESLEATLQYMEETQTIQARQLACIATLREALLRYYEACEVDGGPFSNESFEDLRD